MPAKGWKKSDSRTYTAQLRLSDAERKLFEKASRRANATSLSAWLRKIALAEAQRLGLDVTKT